MASDPMTLTEFEREARELVRQSYLFVPAWGDAERAVDAIRPLILRLLAGERERCAGACNSEIKDAQGANMPGAHILSAVYCRKRIKKLEDPT